MIIKQDQDGNPVAGVTFRIEKPNGEFVKEVTTDETGKASVSDLDSGDYVVTEIRVPDGMLLDTTPKNVTIKDGETATVTFINDSRSGIRIVKTVEQTGKPLEGVEFSIERDNGEKITVALDELEARIPELLETVQQGLFDKAKRNLDEHTYAAHSLAEAKELQEKNGGFIKTMWCGDLACELEMKEKAGMSSRCIPFEQEHIDDVCPVCGKPAKCMIYWGVAY